MTKKYFFTIITIVAFVIGVCVFSYIRTKTIQLTRQLGSDEIKLSGTITAVDNGCAHDDICKIRVGSYWIITDLGGDPNTEMIQKRGRQGTIVLADGTSRKGAIEELSSTGKHVEIFARVLDGNTLTLYGSPQYYIKFLYR